jgi:hypothetical protein
MINPKFQQTIIENLCPEFLLHVQKQQEDSMMMLAIIPEMWQKIKHSKLI